VLTVAESAAVPVPHPWRVSGSVGGVAISALHFVASQCLSSGTRGTAHGESAILQGDVTVNVLHFAVSQSPWGSVLRLGVTA
jgi:hypothetical protein